MNRRNLNHFAGCLLGGAVGDALGASVEFDSLADIRARFGERGITRYAPAYGAKGRFTDDTQMTLFTAEGLLRAHARGAQKGITSYADVTYLAYLRWLATQEQSSPHPAFAAATLAGHSWLFDLPELHSRRGPGNTCLSALRSGKMGTVAQPINNSKGCGGVMRSAPVGMFFDDPRQAFTVGCDLAAITHSHPGGYLPAGTLAAMLCFLFDGQGIAAALQASLELLRGCEGSAETLALLKNAVELAAHKNTHLAAFTVLGEGWVGDEALAIAVYCALVCEEDFAEGIRLAVNHSGDSDSTGAIAGNLLGARLGKDAIPPEFLAELELAAEIEQLAADLLTRYADSSAWQQRYPGW